MIKGVIFDFDNTLYDYESVNSEALKYTFACMSKQFNINTEIINSLYQIINKNIKSSNNSFNKFNKYIYIKLLFEQLNISIKFIYDYVNIYNEHFYKLFKLHDGVAELFIFLKSKNIKIGILSNNVFLQQLDKLKYANILDYIDIVQTSDECGEEKPNKQIFYLLQSKINIPFENLAFVGDNYDHDILPSVELKMLPFWFNSEFKFKISNNIIKFGNFIGLTDFFINYHKTVNELIFLSKYFGQSSLNVQGPGGNISVKLDNILFIKSSGSILGNISLVEGYCLVDNVKCVEILEKNNNEVYNAASINSNFNYKMKLFGSKNPSIETFFHSFMKKYTVHLHFTLANVFLCSNNNLNLLLSDFEYNYKIIEYSTPGIELASEINKLYDKLCNIYFLKNHGIIITADNIEDILHLYDYVFNYFNNKLNNKYDNELICFNLNELYHKNGKNVIIKNIQSFSIDTFKNIIICFPDLAVFVQKIIEIDDINLFSNNFVASDIILYQNGVFLITENINKMYSLIEILESYIILYDHYKQITNNCNTYSLVEINNILHIQNMPEEKYRKI